MRVTWKKNNKNFNPDIVLSKIERIKIVSDDKKVSYSAFEYHEAMAVLINMVNFPSHCEGLIHENIVSRAVSEIAKNHVLEKDKVMAKINDIVKTELATKEHKYHLLTSISLSQPYPLKEIVIEGARIRIFGKDYPKKYSGRTELINKYPNVAKTPDNYARVIVSLKNKSVKGAATKSLRVLDLIRSFLCLFGNSSMEIYGDQWRPINKVRLGSMHTIHKDSGKVTCDFWYEPNFSSATVFKSTKPDLYSDNCKWAIEQLENIPYSVTLKDALLRYVRALDEKDHNVALIKLWGALEAITAPSDSNYDHVTRRCAFLFKDYDYHKQVLEHLRAYRNSNIHSGDQSENAKTNCYQLQFYFYHLILFHLRNQGVFSTNEEANSFLDLPTNEETLQNRKKLIEKAINFRNA